MHEKKVINFQKWPKWRFLAVNNFFVLFKNTKQNNNCVCIVFKAESEPKHEDQICFDVFLQKPKTRFFGGKNSFETQISNLYFCVCSLL